MTDAPTMDARVSGLPDYHTHTSRCGHATAPAAEYVRAARSLGLGAIGVSDHLPMLHTEEPELSMGLDELPEYVAEVLDLKASYPDFVLLGIEADYHPATVERVKDLVASYPFDYVIGSVHFLQDWGFDDPRQRVGFEERDIDQVYRTYFDLVAEAAASGVFTILGHLDLVKKFGHRPSPAFAGALEDLAEHVARCDSVVEINTAGLHKPIGELYPSADILAALNHHGVPITFGSDAHHPREVGRDFALAVEAAWQAGYRSYAVLQPTGARARVVMRDIPRKVTV